ncbi:hypothetical protein BOM23_17415, partial [Erwinia sp. OLMDLW33]
DRRSLHRLFGWRGLLCLHRLFGLGCCSGGISGLRRLANGRHGSIRFKGSATCQCGGGNNRCQRKTIKHYGEFSSAEFGALLS